MLEVVLDYALFLAQAVTVVIAVGAIVFIIASAARKGGQVGDGIQVERLNERMEDLVRPLKQAAMSGKAFKAQAKAKKKARKAAEKKSDEEQRPRVYVLDFKGDMRASAAGNLRHEVTAILGLAETGDTVLLRLENPGGLVHEHGHAASQLARLKDRGLELVVTVDKVAASGGYMMACIGSRILAAPFAVLGSIGVLAQIPNVNRLLEERGVDVEMFKGGEFKRTVTMLGRNTDEDRARFQQEINETHTLFKQFVAEHRPDLDLDRVATGEHWFGKDALGLGLCDEIGTSDEWLLKKSEDSDLLQVRYRRREPIGKRLANAMEDAPARALERVMEKLWHHRL